jgi:peptidoglycan/LPS O-acetylase OafA/YrhL
MNSKNYSQDFMLRLRGVACLIVVWWHLLPPRNLLWINGVDLTFLFHPNVFAAVWIFFLISGYGIGKGFFSGRYEISLKGMLHFYRNRIIRIVPLYYLVVFLCAFVLFPGRIGGDMDEFVKLLTFTVNNPLYMLFNSPLAIVSTEMQFYLIAPALFVVLRFLLRKIPTLLICTGIIMLGSFFRMIGCNWNSCSGISEYLSIYSSLLGNLDVFLFGMVIGFLVTKRKDHQQSDIFHALIFTRIIPVCIMFFVYCVASFYSYNFVDLYSMYIKYMLYVIPPIVYCGIGYCIMNYEDNQYKSHIIQPNPKSILLNFKNLNYLLANIGVLSFGIYLSHFAIAEALLYVWSQTERMEIFLPRFIITLILSILFSYGGYCMVEYPFHRLRFSKRQTEETN